VAAAADADRQRAAARAEDGALELPLGRREHDGGRLADAGDVEAEVTEGGVEDRLEALGRGRSSSRRWRRGRRRCRALAPAGELQRLPPLRLQRGTAQGLRRRLLRCVSPLQIPERGGAQKMVDTWMCICNGLVCEEICTCWDLEVVNAH
jgi:hypothetical protein